MSKKKNQSQPTASELAILQILWNKGPLSVRDIHDILSQVKDVVYTTILKTMQIMTERGFLVRESAGRKHIYSAVIAQEDTQNKLLDKFLERTFGGSAKRMVMRALGNYNTSPEDLEDLKNLISELEENKTEEE